MRKPESFHLRDTQFIEFGYLLIKNSFLGDLVVSAVRYPWDHRNPYGLIFPEIIIPTYLLMKYFTELTGTTIESSGSI